MSVGNLPRAFFDTNVLVYADDARSPIKQAKARELWSEYRQERAGVVSLQVLQEYFVTVTQKVKLDVQIARRKVELFAKVDVAIAGVADILAAIDLQRLYQLSFWDALILRMAKESGCRIIFSEDMQHMQQLDGIQIVNPFL
jgi:predicted nucleic acid-binding protein